MVVNPISAGVNFIYDIISRCYNPVALLTTIEEDSKEHLEFKKVKVGGFIFIPKTTYDCLRSKRNGMEALLKTFNLRIEVLQYEIRDMIIASKT